MRSNKTLKRTKKTTAPKRKQTRNRRKLRGGSGSRGIFIQRNNPKGPGYTSNQLPTRKNPTFEEEELMINYPQRNKANMQQVQQQVEQLNHEDKASLFQKLATMLGITL